MMLEIGVQTKGVIADDRPLEGFELLKRNGFSCCDFSLNDYLKNKTLYRQEVNRFFDKPARELEQFFTPHKDAAKAAGVRIHQMHMPYPIHVPGAPEELNDYLKQIVAAKSMELCAFLECPYIVVHGFKLAHFLGSEEAEWERTRELLEFLMPMARESGIIVCIENLYTNIGQKIVEGPCCNAAKAAERIDRMNEKYGAEVLGFCFDTGHANLVGLDFEHFIAVLGSRLKVLHIHDNDGVGDLHQIPFAFTKSRENTASTDWDGFLKGLARIGFQGALSFETAPALSSFPKAMKPAVLGFVAEIGNYFAGELERLESALKPGESDN